MKLLIVEKLEIALRDSDGEPEGSSLEGIERLLAAGLVTTADKLETAWPPFARQKPARPHQRRPTRQSDLKHRDT